ncbi:MAG: hypothetical protein IJS54_00965 [Desulfovibrio sp.]|nr:hypothetical protein [Desulfovibrio sp.]
MLRENKLAAWAVLGCVGLCGCAQAVPAAYEKAVAGYAAMGKESGMQVVAESCLLGETVPLVEDTFLAKAVVLRMQGDVASVCTALMRLGDCQVSFVPESGDEAKESNPVLTLDYTGPVRGLLDTIAAQSGYGWEYNQKPPRIVFAKTMVKTFVLKTAPGSVRFGTRVTNQSRETDHGRHFSQNTVQHATASAQIAQDYQGDLSFDAFGDTVAAVRGMLTKKGVVAGNPAAGTIVVRDTPESLRRIGQYIEQMNALFARQVAMKVHVYALETSDDARVGFDVSALLPKLSVGANHAQMALGALARGSGLGTAQALVLDGQLAGSEAMLTALKEFGYARQITSAGIVTLNNQPAPVEAIQKVNYLAGQTTERTDYGTETSLTPGEVTTGFSMTITPHIMDGGRVVLQYNVHLATLDAMDTFESKNSHIQLPRVSTRAFSQKASMMMGQTLVLAGFQHAKESAANNTRLLGFGRTKTKESSMLIVTIALDEAGARERV